MESVNNKYEIDSQLLGQIVQVIINGIHPSIPFAAVNDILRKLEELDKPSE